MKKTLYLLICSFFALNIHGTHLAVTEFISPNKLVVRYMHPQTYGFQSFLPGNDIEFIDSHSLISRASFKVKSAEMKNEREIIITLNKPIPPEIRKIQELVVENTTYTPEVVISNNFFTRIPTRGILISTRRKVVIENNTFFRMQMSGILIAPENDRNEGYVHRNIMTKQCFVISVLLLFSMQLFAQVFKPGEI